MKTILKILLFLVAITLLLGVGLAMIFYYSPSLQKTVVVRGIEGSTGISTEIEYIRIRLSGMELRGLKLEAGEETLTLKSMRADYSPGKLTGDPSRLESVNLEGLVVDISAAMGGDFAAAAGEKEVTSEESESPSIGQIKIPASIGKMTMDGEIRLPEGVLITVQTELTDLSPDSVALLKADLSITGPASETKADLTAKATLEGTTLSKLEASLEADQFNTDEWKPLLASMPQSEESAAVDRTADENPLWDGMVGTLEAKLGILRINDNTIEDLSAKIVIPKSGPVEISTSAQSSGSPLQTQLQLAFNEENPASPYSLEGTATVKKFDVTPYLRTSPNDRNPMLEGTFDLDGSFQSTAPNLSLLAEKLSGNAKLTSVGKGTFRPLGEKTSMASGVSGLLGALSGSVKELGWVREVIDQLKEIPYTEMTFSVAREPSLDLVLQQLDLISRETRIRGQGEIQYKEGVELLQLPMDMKFQLFAKGRLAEALRSGGQLRSQEAHARGFYPGPPLPVKGTLAEPESLLQNMLMDSAPQLVPKLFGN